MSSDGMHTGMDLGGLSPGAGEMGAAGMGMASQEECSRMVELRALLVQAAEDQVPRMIMNALAWRSSEQASRVLNAKGGGACCCCCCWAGLSVCAARINLALLLCLVSGLLVT